jgi:shikimate 5-dehydrogenase
MGRVLWRRPASRGLRGLAVTMPHKVVVAESVDSLDPPRHALRSVNTVVFSDGGTRD